MRAGRLRHHVTIMRLVATKDGTTGVVTNTWDQFGYKAWAAIEPLKIAELLQADQAQSKVSALITIRYRDGLLPSMRIHHRTNIYKIEGILPDKKSGREFITLAVSEVQRG